METQVWVVVALDREHRPRGVEKVCDGKFYMTNEDAHQARQALPLDVRRSFGIAEAILTIGARAEKETPCAHPNAFHQAPENDASVDSSECPDCWATAHPAGNWPDTTAP